MSVSDYILSIGAIFVLVVLYNTVVKYLKYRRKE